MTEEEKMAFWGDLVEPMTALVGGLVVRGEFKLADAFRKIVDKAERAALEERERILDMCKEGLWDGEGIRAHLEKRGSND